MALYYAHVGEDGVSFAATLSDDAEAASEVLWIATNGDRTLTVTAVAGEDGAVSVTLDDTVLADENVGRYAFTWRVTGGAGGDGPLDYPSDPADRDLFVLSSIGDPA